VIVATMVSFQAHPDDECITTGGVMRKASDEGHRVVLVVATRGELGEVEDGFLDPGERLADRRVAETFAAAEILGAQRVEFLDYGDSEVDVGGTRAESHTMGWEETYFRSGDTVYYAGIRNLSARVSVHTAILHLGRVKFPITGPLRYTMTARDAVELCRLLRPRTAIPIHYEGWKHFREGREAIERELDKAPGVRRSIRWLPLGVSEGV
jgi:hypothetical protein